MMSVASLVGQWRRSLLELPDGTRDVTTEVTWLQAHPHFADLRQPAGMPDFSHVAGLDDLTAEDCRWLATQLGFAGFFRRLDDGFEWVRLVDFWPPGPVKDIGRLSWEGDVLVEVGRDAPYLEHWHRDVSRAVVPAASFILSAVETAAPGLLVRVGASFMYARGRAAPLPAGASLAELVAAAPDVQAARVLLDCEISQGVIEDSGWRIVRSTLPYRVGDDLAPLLNADRVSVAGGAAGRMAWQIIEAQGDVSGFFDVCV
jgi:hypothetical protein